VSNRFSSPGSVLMSGSATVGVSTASSITGIYFGSPDPDLRLDYDKYVRVSSVWSSDHVHHFQATRAASI